MILLDLLKPASKETQTARILKLLKTNGSATNTQLNRICFRFSARIHDLRSEGWDILSVREKDGLWRFVLKGHRDDAKEVL
ncbi:helix-turn-helix domain-containing protein [Pseudarthrobacter sp. H2]|uniref:helix-turn-helix domain-containing protein n=1 Tax=Pseudarthrobacter sp. H2 TaxID=3418415 RepID=UPI003CE853C4